MTKRDEGKFIESDCEFKELHATNGRTHAVGRLQYQVNRYKLEFW